MIKRSAIGTLVLSTFVTAIYGMVNFVLAGLNVVTTMVGFLFVTLTAVLLLLLTNRDQKQEATYTLHIKHGKVPASTYLNSRSMAIDENGMVDTVYGAMGHEGKFIGRVRLAETKYGFYETHAAFKPQYCDKGLGSKLYVHTIKAAMNLGIEVRSSTTPTLDAQRVWTGSVMNESFVIQHSGTRYKIVREQ